MTVTAGQLAHAVHANVVAGTYPDSDDVYSASLPSDALPEIIAHLEKAQEEVNEEIRKVSRANGPELDPWIRQARRLQADIDASNAQADRILALAAQEEALETELADAEAQQRFLEAEIRFNDELLGRLGLLQMVSATLGQAAALSAGGELAQAMVVLEGAERALAEMTGETIVVELMKERAAGLRKSVVERVERGWTEIVCVRKEEGELRIRREITEGDSVISSTAVVEALQALSLLNTKVDHLHQQLDTLLISPLLDTQRAHAPTFTVTGDTLTAAAAAAPSTDLSAARMFASLRLIINFLHAQLPPAVTSPLSRILVSSLTTRLTSSTLPHSVPSSLDRLPALEALLADTCRFEDHLQSIAWTRDSELREWAGRAPRVWLAKRRETCLDTLRQTVAQGIRETKVVERSETQKVPTKPEQRRNSAGAAVWNEDWKEEEETQAVAKEVAKGLDMAIEDDDDDDDDASGWGLDEDLDIDDPPPAEPAAKPGQEQEQEQEPEKAPAPAEAEAAPQEEEEEEELDWGEWGDDDEPAAPATPKTADYTPTTSESAHSSSPEQPPPPPPLPTTSSSSTSKDVTLKETYTITSIPDAILTLITTLTTEASHLTRLPRNAITPAAPDLHTLPPLLLAAYRALAPLHYAHHPAAGMLLYNDTQRLTSLLPPTIPPEDAARTAAFGKRTYARELHSQRLVLTDYLDSAQGFVNCTSYPQSAACATAIASTVAHMQQLRATWSPILSRSALSQSLGSLLNAVCARLISDVEDISDIAAAESERLAGLCEELAAGVEALFPVSVGGVGMVAVYCGAWIKFRALQQVLESSMVEICYLWREGLVAEFGVEEMCELVVALFQEGENRRRCLEEIRGRR
ncbi:uncharacterized protein H6S33_002203 [Morchella sextelata]|uniref:uncharacterized protein n=1 Tax=Morchella sextelata TaxID=1174677 RepID=UPI001D05B30F|nr:uncharacterized protein H6S33_002203 [Morchella sextelata]KAH0608151.1 hypothetical protein H6S33_002203 [Morchella sextelata]